MTDGPEPGTILAPPRSGALRPAGALPAPMKIPAGLPPLPPRPRGAHKGSMGRALLVAGSRGMAGAAALAAEAALRAGAGYAVLAAPGSISADLTAAVPPAVLQLCGGPGRDRLLPADLKAVLGEVRRADAVAVGPGLGGDPETGEFVTGLLEALGEPSTSVPVVLDADGLNLLAARRAAGGGRRLQMPARALLTPHPGEAARLLGLDGGPAVQADRAGALAALVELTGATVLLKGAGTLVGAPGQTAWANSTGNPGMATAGCGDVLTGLIAALLARGLEPWEAARAGAWIHGRAGDLAAGETGQESLLASDLLKHLPQVLRAWPVQPAE